jgi:hypothetical protein
MFESDLIIEPDLLIQSNDIVIKNANEQNIKHLLIAKGNYILAPAVGVGIYTLQNSSITDYRSIVSKIKQELRNDGYDDVQIGGETDTVTGESQLSVTALRVTTPKETNV